MSNAFDIVDGILYVDKQLFNEAQLHDNSISQLTASHYTNLYTAGPRFKTGPETVIIDYTQADVLHIDRDPMDFIEELRKTYPNQVRGCITIHDQIHPRKSICINSY